MFIVKISYYKSGEIESEQHHKAGYLHRGDGPAKIKYNEDGEIREQYYYLDGVEYEDKDITDNWEVFCKMQIFR